MRKGTETAASEDLDVFTRTVVGDLHAPRPGVFWADLAVTGFIGWPAFALAVATPPTSWLMPVASIVAALALYRGVCFIHELTHLRRGSVPGFEIAWNLVFGVPLLLPSFTYIGVHQSHHNLATYGTTEDPEYLPFARSRGLIALFALHASLVTPLALLVRFLLMAPLGLLWPRFHRWLETHASSFAMNMTYRRVVTAAMSRKIRVWEGVALACWTSVLVGMRYGVVPARLLPVWYFVVALISFVNTARVLGAHAYESDGAPRSRLGQLADSIDTPGGPWSELWAPVGLRYHALHHFFPGIPYHNLGVAYRRLMQALPEHSVYRDSTSPSLPWSLRQLNAKARRFAAGAR
jgi:fatty acid desaturase